MIAVIDAQLAWWPPTFSPSALSRMWLAWWIVQALSQRSLSSASLRAAMSGAAGFSMTNRLDQLCRSLKLGPVGRRPFGGLDVAADQPQAKAGNGADGDGDGEIGD